MTRSLREELPRRMNANTGFPPSATVGAGAFPVLGKAGWCWPPSLRCSSLVHSFFRPAQSLVLILPMSPSFAACLLEPVGLKPSRPARMPPWRPRGWRRGSPVWLRRRAIVPFIRPKRDGRHRCPLRLRVQPTQRMANRLGWELEMSERRITQLFGLGLGAIITCTMVLNAFAF